MELTKGMVALDKGRLLWRRSINIRTSNGNRTMIMKEEFENNVETQILSEQTKRLRRLIESSHDSRGYSDEDALIIQPAPREIVLHIRGMTEIIGFRESSTIILGRDESRMDTRIDVDLTPYGALDRGVSRLHAQLMLVNEQRLYIMDLNSKNGTFLDGESLDPFKPYLLRKGCDLVLGQLPLQIFFTQS